MAYDSQQTNLDAVSDLSTLAHEVFTNSVLPFARFESVTQQLFTQADSESDYEFTGTKLKGAIDLQRPGNAMGTGGQLPDSMTVTPANWEATPVRRYVRRATDHFVAAAVQGRGAFASHEDRLFDQMWAAWTLMEISHAVGGSDGVLCHIASRTSSTVVVVDNGLGHSGMDPLLFLDEGITIAWLDSSNSNAVGGAAVVSSINYSTSAVTVDSASTWEPSPTPADGDLIVRATTNDTTRDYFATEYQKAQNGMLDIVDPDANNTTVFGIAQGTYPRWKPYRVSSSTWDHIEITEFLRQLRAKSSMPVTPDTHTCVTSGGPVAELARTLLGFQQQQNLGKTLEGGYQTVRIAGADIAEDDYSLHDVFYCVCNEDIKRESLAEAGYIDEDGSMRSRLADFDGSEWAARDYSNVWTVRRNRHGAITGITLSNVDGADYTPTPNY